MCKYADDCTIYESVPSGCSSNMQKVLVGLQSWATTNNMLLNPNKTKDMWISFRKHSIEPGTLPINNAQVERVSQFKLLGVWQQSNLRWNYHVEQTIKKACKRLYHLRECRKARLPTEVGITVYGTKIRPLLEYASQVWIGLPQYLVDDLQSIQNRCLDIIGTSRASLPKLEQRRMEATKRELERTIEDINHPNQGFFSKSSTSYSYHLRFKSGPVLIPRSGTQRHANSFIVRGARLLNS